MRGGAVAEIEHDLVDVAPAPAFRWVVAFDDRMVRRVEMTRGVPVRRSVAASDMTARSAEAQMHPRRADLQTLLAAERTWRHIANGVDMGASFCHRDPLMARFCRRLPRRRREARRPVAASIEGINVSWS